LDRVRKSNYNKNYIKFGVSYFGAHFCNPKGINRVNNLGSTFLSEFFWYSKFDILGKYDWILVVLRLAHCFQFGGDCKLKFMIW
jgi:hypothetical protein